MSAQNRRPSRTRRPRSDGETWLRQQLAGLEIPAEATDPDVQLLGFLAAVHLVYHYGPADKRTMLKDFLEGLVPDITTPRLWASRPCREWLGHKFMAQLDLLTRVTRRQPGAEG